MRHWLLLYMAIGMAATAAPCRGQQPENLVKATIAADTTAIEPGKPFRLAVTFRIEPHWHIYWQNPGDGGIPTTVDLRLPDGFTASAFEYPVPTRFDEPGGIMVFGYEDQATLIATITPPARLESKPASIAARANWLVCDKTCVTGNANLQLTLPAGPAKPANQELFKQAAEKLAAVAERAPSVAGVQQHITPKPGGERPAGEFQLTIQWKSPPPAAIDWFAPPTQALAFGRPVIRTEGSTTTVTASVERVPGLELNRAEMSSVVRYSADNATRGLTVLVDAASLAKGP